MNILMITATPIESKILKKSLQRRKKIDSRFCIGQLGKHKIYLLETGIGMVNTVYWITKYLHKYKFDLLLNIGICGCIDKKIPLCSVLEIQSETFLELGAEGFKNWIPLHKLKITLIKNSKKILYEKIQNPRTASSFQKEIKSFARVHSVTVNSVHSNKNSIDKIRKHTNATVENMEGGAVFYVGTQEKIPFLEFRSVSNYMNGRNRKNWKIKEASEAVQNFTLTWLKHLN